MKSHNDRRILLSFIGIGIIAGIGGHFFELLPVAFPSTTSINSASAILATEQNLVSPTAPSLPISLGFAGSIRLDSPIQSIVQKDLGGDYTKLFARSGFLKKPDISFASLEGPISAKGTDPKSLSALRDAGIDILSVGSAAQSSVNRKEYEDTLTKLRSAGILTCGWSMNKTEARTPAIIHQNGFSVGFLCFSDTSNPSVTALDNSSGILSANDKDFDAIIQSAAGQTNALIVAFNFGAINQAMHTPHEEQLAKQAINDGAVMVLGTNAHRPQDIQYVSGKPIFYNLGNFIYNDPAIKGRVGGLSLTATLSGKTISNITPHLIILDKNFVPRAADEILAAK